jgi:anaerobic ribonucleoside-triphosphate reductase activating protein
MKNSLKLNLAAFLKNTRMAGPGLRDVVWVQGCRIGCRGCANQAYLAHEPRIQMPVERLIVHFKARKNQIDGCSISGGEPTEQAEGIGMLLHEIKKLGLSTVVFTGRPLKSLQTEPTCQDILNYTDLLIDGPFIEAQRDFTLHWRGSKNQKLHLLSNRWTAEEIEQSQSNGEIMISKSRILFHGIGTHALIEQT